MTSTRTFGFGTELRSSYPWGLFAGGKVMCSDGVVRSLHSIAPTADTFSTVPAQVVVRGRTVSGHIEVETAHGWSTETEDDPAVVKFVASLYGKNADALPPGRWKLCEGCEDCEIPGVRWPSATNCDETREWIERCDTCERYESDAAAAEAVSAHTGRPVMLARPVGLHSLQPYLGNSVQVLSKSWHCKNERRQLVLEIVVEDASAIEADPMSAQRRGL